MSMAGYTKLFNTILASTIWREDDRTRIVWITMLAAADRDGVVEASVPGLADFARVPVEDCRRALEALSRPDPDSRSKEYSGRRIEPVEGGWRLLNHAKYRAKMNSDDRREYLRKKQAEYRKRKQASTHVNNVSDKSTVLTHAEAEAKADTEAEARTERVRASRGPAPIHDTGHKRHAFCGRVCVHASQHNDFVRRRNHDGADEELRTWYLAVNAEWMDGAHQADEPGDPFDFWRARYEERWPALKVDKRVPEWAR